ncbi:MFS transporter [Amphibiibacter pelophylacis]|uniref:MFS transporter n=1 Tax=Amphibiibacter pelophylacis TaxID=1799477 RepID=A0ACC6P5B1_9BURK
MSAPSPAPDSLPRRTWWHITLAAAAILMVTMGVRQSMGLFVAPLDTATGLGIVSISFALAVGQFVWGAVQPVAGAVADRWGPAPVLAGGVLLMALGLVMTTALQSSWGLTFALGVLMAAGSGAGSFSVLIGAAAQKLPASQRGMASGVINAGGSFGQFVFAPLTQGLIALVGWTGALWGLAVATLAALPLIGPLRNRKAPQTASAAAGADAARPAAPQMGLRAAVRQALGDRSYWLLHAGFFTCGFHIAFLVTHLPGEVHLCGLPPQVASWSLAIIGLANVVGSLLAGWAVQRVRSKFVLFWMYASRAGLILVYLAAPKTELSFYLFAAGLGLTWLATVPPTAGIVAKLFGPRYLATLFGLTLLSHQIGGFLGAWLGGLALERMGDYHLMWWADIALASAAALINLPIREEKVVRLQAA